MPCYRVQRTNIEFGQKTNADHMLAALNALKLNALRSNGVIRFNGGYYNERYGTMTLEALGQDAEKQTAEIKRAYMTQATMATAKRFGFQVKQVGANKFQAIKRTL